MNWTNEEVTILRQYETTGKSKLRIYEDLKRSGSLRSFNSMDHKIRQMVMNKEMSKPHKMAVFDNLRAGYLDIETTSLKADFGFMLSWAIKERGKDHVDHALIERKHLYGKVLDSNLLKSLLKCLEGYDLIYTYNGSRFDVPFVRSRCLRHGIDFIPHGNKFHKDIYYSAKHLLCIRSKRLATVSEFLGIEGKTPLSGNIWMEAVRGDKESLGYVLEHNIADVLVTERVHNRLEDYESGMRRFV